MTERHSLGPRDTDLGLIQNYQLDALGALLHRPRRYVQRMTERMSFVEHGQRWQRDLQFVMPEPFATATVEAPQPFVVSLGMFARRRFPDFTVTNGDGGECALVTRRQHGHMLAVCMVQRLLLPHEWRRFTETRAAAQPILARLHNCIAAMLTTMPVSTEFKIGDALEELRNLLQVLNISDKGRVARAEKLLRYSCSVIELQTQYLCWVMAKPGDIVRLTATYTTADVPIIDAHTFEEADEVTPAWHLWWRNKRTRAYSRNRMLPLHYRLSAPANDHCGSYYFTVDPPADARVSLLEWGNGRRLQPERGAASSQAREVDSATITCHLHNGERPAAATSATSGEVSRRFRPTEIQGARLHTFIRPESFDHNKLSAIGLLSLALAWLAQNGSFVTATRGVGTQWLLVTPAAMLVFIGQQQRHHSGRFTRSFRVSMWLYIGASVLFAGVEALSLNGAAGRTLSQGVGNDVISGGFALVSGAVALMFFATGQRFDRVVERRFIRTLERVRKSGTPSFFEHKTGYRRHEQDAVVVGDDTALFGDRGRHPADRIYTAVARHYIDRTLLYVAVACLLGALAMVKFGWGESRRDVIASQKKAAQVIGGRQPNTTARMGRDTLTLPLLTERPAVERP